MVNYENYYFESSSDSLETIQFLEDRIYEFNSSKIKKKDGHLFSKVLKDDKGEVVGGIAGWTWAGACEVTQLWVDEKMRARGIGKALLDAAELEAKDKGCLIILIKTYSFQAPGFYLKQGFIAQHVTKDFPKGYSYYTMVKIIG